MDSMYFEDYQAGTSVTTSGRTITEADIVNFACLSGDFNPIHTNVEFAKKGAFGERIAHGMLGLSVLTGLIHEAGIIKTTVVAFTGLTWKFTSIVKIGDTFAGIFTVLKSRGLGPKQGMIVFSVKLTNQRGETVGEGEWSLLVKKRELVATAS